MRDNISFFAKISVTHKLITTLKCRCSFLNNEKGVGFDFPKHYLIPMGQNTPKDNDNFSHLKSLQWVFKFL